MTVNNDSTITAVVVHTAFEKFPQVVATVLVPNNTESSAELVYNLTQNIFGSWSKGPTIENEHNPDYDARVQPSGKFKINPRTGKEMGHRSTSVGDIILIENTAYVVDSFGFLKQDGWQSILEATEI